MPLILGILIQFYFALDELIIGAMFITVLLGVIIISLLKLPFHLQYLKGIVLNVFIVSCGILITNLRDVEFQPIPNSEKTLLIGEITKLPDERAKNYKTEILLESQKENSSWEKVNTKIIAHIEKDTSLLSLKAGNKIVFSTKVSPMRSQQNPFGFNYAKYLSHKQIDNIVYIKKGEWTMLLANEHGFKNRALNLRQKIINLFIKYEIEDDNLAILSALSLGYKNTLDQEIRKAYNGAGAAHVLAVSGLHVGIIYLVLNFFLGWLTLFFSLRKLKFIIIFVALWGYAFLTGLSPSVLRATVMFSFVLAGFILDKRVNIYNSLAASAFFLLLLNPFLLFDIGFQLSYSAVLGIVFFHPKIYGLIFFKYKLFNWIWSLTVVSIAAQLATFPITVYHFHQFPIYFWMGNIVVTVSAALLIFLSIVLIAFSSLPIFSIIIGKIIKLIIELNFGFIQWINELPFSLITGISFSTIQVFTLYILILSFAIWLVVKKYLPLIVCLLSILLLGGLGNSEYISRSKQGAFCIYQTSYETAIQFVDYNKSWWFVTKKQDNSRINSIVEEGNLYWKTTLNEYYEINNLGDSIIENDNCFYNSGYWATQKSKGFIITTTSTLPQIPKDTLCLDYLIVTGKPKFNFKDFPSKIVFNKIIVDGSVPNWKARKFISDNEHLNIYYTGDEGAFVKMW